MYYHDGAKVHRDIFIRALRMVHTAPMVEAGLPSAGRVSLLHQPEENRYVAHLLYGPPLKRGRCEVIEDLPELFDVKVRLRLPKPVKSLRLIPDNTELPLTRTAELVETIIPGFSAHCAVVAEY